MAEAASVLAGIGLPPNKVEETLKNKKLTADLLEIVKASGVTLPVEKEIGNLFYFLPKINAGPARNHLARLIGERKITLQEQLLAAQKFLQKADEPVELKVLEEITGAGVKVTAADIDAATEAVFQVHPLVSTSFFQTNIII